MPPIVHIALAGVVVPALVGLVGVGAVARKRPNHHATSAAAGGVVGVAVFMAYVVRFAALPGWPPTGLLPWLAWLGAAGGALAVVDGLMLDHTTRKIQATRFFAPVALAVVAPRRVLPEGWTADEARWQLALATAGLFLLWLVIDQLLARLSTRMGAALLCGMGFGVAVAMAPTAMDIAHLLGAQTACLGGIVVVAMTAYGTDVSLRSAALPVAMTLGTATWATLTG